MRKITILFTSAVLALGVLASSAVTVAASGNCGTGYVILYASLSYGGGSRTYCYGVNDAQYSAESPVNIMGPLAAGTYADDFDGSNGTSGVSSYHFVDVSGGTDVIVCFYANGNFGGLVQWDNTSGYYQMDIGSDNVTESFAFSTYSQGCP
jgi:hypothetical protein